MTMRVPAALLALLLVACSGGDPPRPVTDFASPAPTGPPLRPLSSRETPDAAAGSAAPAPIATDPDDPAEPGIGDLPRLARYVFRVMGRHESICALENPYRDSIHFALDIEVKGGRMTRVAIGHAGLEGEERTRPLAPAEWPGELTDYVACLTPHLKAVAMDPAPADGVYQPTYSFGGRPEGRPTP